MRGLERRAVAPSRTAGIRPRIGAAARAAGSGAAAYGVAIPAAPAIARRRRRAEDRRRRLRRRGDLADRDDDAGGRNALLIDGDQLVVAGRSHVAGGGSLKRDGLVRLGEGDRVAALREVEAVGDLAQPDQHHLRDPVRRSELELHCLAVLQPVRRQAEDLRTRREGGPAVHGRKQVGRIVELGVLVEDGTGRAAAGDDQRPVLQQHRGGVVAAVDRARSADRPAAGPRIPALAGQHHVAAAAVVVPAAAGHEHLTGGQHGRVGPAPSRGHRSGLGQDRHGPVDVDQRGAAARQEAVAVGIGVAADLNDLAGLVHRGGRVGPDIRRVGRRAGLALRLPERQGADRPVPGRIEVPHPLGGDAEDLPVRRHPGARIPEPVEIRTEGFPAIGAKQAAPAVPVIDLGGHAGHPAAADIAVGIGPSAEIGIGTAHDHLLPVGQGEHGGIVAVVGELRRRGGHGVGRGVEDRAAPVVAVLEDAARDQQRPVGLEGLRRAEAVDPPRSRQDHVAIAVQAAIGIPDGEAAPVLNVGPAAGGAEGHHFAARQKAHVDRVHRPVAHARPHAEGRRAVGNLEAGEERVLHRIDHDAETGGLGGMKTRCQHRGREQGRLAGTRPPPALGRLQPCHDVLPLFLLEDQAGSRAAPRAGRPTPSSKVSRRVRSCSRRAPSTGSLP